METFYEKISVPFLQSTCSYGAMLPMLARWSVLNKKTLTSGGIYGSGEIDIIDRAIKVALEVLPNAFIAMSSLNEKMERANTVVVCDAGIVEFQLYEDIISCPFALVDVGLVAKLTELLSAVIPLTIPAKGNIYAIGKGIDGLQLSKIGQIGVPIVPDNYIGSVIDQFKHVVADLAKTNPCGRLVVLSGVPGTGKTFMVRGLVHASSEDSTFVVIPPHVVHALGDPEFINLLIDHKRDNRNDEKALVLVLEDADSALVPRGGDNMPSVSGLLNLSDGLLGRALDIRIIATTNAEIKEMDDALMRPGRLCQHITTKPLSEREAQALADKLAPGTKIRGPATLAEIYKWTSGNFLPEQEKQKPSMGF